MFLFCLKISFGQNDMLAILEAEADKFSDYFKHPWHDTNKMKALHGHAVTTDIDIGPALEVIEQVLDDAGIKVLTTQVGVTCFLEVFKASGSGPSDADRNPHHPSACHLRKDLFESEH